MEEDEEKRGREMEAGALRLTKRDRDKPGQVEEGREEQIYPQRLC